MNDIYRQLVENGWSINDIEETDFELLMSVVSAKKKDNKKVIPLDEFINKM